MPSRENPNAVAWKLAVALLAGRWQHGEIGETIRAVFKTGDITTSNALANSLIARNTNAYPPSPVRLIDLLKENPRFHQLCKSSRPNRIDISLDPPRFAPAPRFADLDVPQIKTAADLADWLRISVTQLDWLADSYRTAADTHIPILQHYRYGFAPKRLGPPRVIEAPKPTLRRIQRRILRQILDRVPAHDAAHGFVAKRSAHTAASIHGSEHVVIACDLKDFFLTTPLRRVHGTFRSLGYPWNVSRLLTGLCSASMPSSAFRRLPGDQRHDWLTQQIYASPHLPAGAPTSPALANLAAFALDARLSGLARSCNANYTRYADDLTFSGDMTLARRTDKLLAAVTAIAADEGYAVNPRKTRIMPRATRQQVLGIVVNSHNNLARPEYDRLKAILHNCARHGPATQNRDNHVDFHAHLLGKVTWAENISPHRARKLRALFERIVWD